MKIKPIIFSAPMVRALLAGTKTQTRRLCAWANNPNSPQLTYIVACDEPGWFGDEEGEVQFTVPYVPGDKLYVREGLTLNVNAEPAFTYAADGTRVKWGNRQQVVWLNEYPRQKCPSIHMPRWASRLWLTVTDVLVQRLQDISEADCIAEGIEHVTTTDAGDFYHNFQNPTCPLMAYGAYRSLWDHINGAGAWDANPWIVAYTFTVHEGNVDAA